MSVTLTRSLEALVLPPGGMILLILLGLLLWRWRRLSWLLILLGLSLQYLLSTPYLAARLMAPLEPYPALTLQQLQTTPAKAIVVLGGGRYEDAREYGGDTVNHLLLGRLRYAAWLQRHTDLPIIASGGSPLTGGPPEAELARQVLEREFGARVRAVEDRSRTTWENARFTAPILVREGLTPVLLVSDAWHLPRARYSFAQAGIDTLPAPTYFRHRPEMDNLLGDWLPSAKALLDSYHALHEYVGLWWYRWRPR